jgi:hypothetical protein
LYFKTEAALYHDAVKLFATSLKELDISEHIYPKKISCKHPTMWAQGVGLASYFRKKNEDGITGVSGFNTQGKKLKISNLKFLFLTFSFSCLGQRSHFHGEIIELDKNGFKPIANWDPIDGISYVRSPIETQTKIVVSLQNKNFVIVSKLGEPFLMER